MSQNLDYKEFLKKDQKESQVGRKLSEQTTKKVIVMVLVVLVSVPLCDVDSYITEPKSFRYGLDLIYRLGGPSGSGKRAFNDMVAFQ